MLGPPGSDQHIPKEEKVGDQEGASRPQQGLTWCRSQALHCSGHKDGEIHEASGREGSPAGARIAWLGVSLRRQAGSRRRAEEVEVCGGKEVWI